jgi:apolipoprotein N-acyltransferase
MPTRPQATMVAGTSLEADLRKPEPLAPKAGSAPLSGPVAYAAAVVSGALYWLAFPGVDFWPLALVAWVPLIVAMRGQSTRRTTLLGWTTGLTMNVAGFFWLQKMLETFSGFPGPLCFVFVLILCSYQAGRVGLLGWIGGRATSRGWPAAGVFVLAFVASELLYPLLFPWYYGATAHTVPVLMQTAELGGPIAVGLVLVAANLAVSEPVLAWIERRRVRWATTLSAAGVLIFALGYGALRIRSVDADVLRAPEARVGIVQANMGLMEKRKDFDEGLHRHLRLSSDLRARGADFLVWSETSAMRAVRDSSYRAELRSVAQQVGLPTVFGAVIVRPVSDEREYVLYNSAVASAADGSIGSRYDKQYLLTFGEYLPFGDTFPVLHRWSPNSGHFTPGTSLDPLLIDIRGEKHPVTVLICYEDVLPEFTNDAVRHADPELLINLTNDAWFLDTAEPWEHFALTQMRSVEHRRYLVRGTNSGVSGVVDPVGRVVAQSGTFRQEALLAPIRWMRAHTLYETIGDWPWVIVSAVGVILAFVRRGPPIRVSAPS